MIFTIYSSFNYHCEIPMVVHRDKIFKSLNIEPIYLSIIGFLPFFVNHFLPSNLPGRIRALNSYESGHKWEGMEFNLGFENSNQSEKCKIWGNSNCIFDVLLMKRQNVQNIKFSHACSSFCRIQLTVLKSPEFAVFKTFEFFESGHSFPSKNPRQI